MAIEKLLPTRKGGDVYFVRIQADMYKEIERIAGEQGRTIQMQTQILIGAALNRNLIAPELMEYDVTRNANGTANMKLRVKGSHDDEAALGEHTETLDKTEPA